MRKKSAWEKLKNKFGLPKEDQNGIRRQFLDITRLGGNPIVMKMGN